MKEGKLKDFLEGLKKDKKKGMFILLGLGGLITVIILGVFFGASGTTAEEKKQLAESVIVPVDTVAINKETNGTGNNEFFALNNIPEQEVSAAPVEQNTNNSAPRSTNPKVYTYQKPYTGSNQNSSSTSTKKAAVVEEEPTTSGKRRRAPNDGMGNYTTASKKQMYTGVIANNNQIVKSGSYVSIRVAEDINTGGVVVKRNSVLTGLATYGNQRMDINITSVKVGNTVQNVKWLLVDEDGQDGIAVPESVLNDIIKDGTDDAVEDGGQKVEASVPIIGSIKVNLKKKNKEVSFVINNGHRVFIREKKI